MNIQQNQTTNQTTNQKPNTVIFVHLQKCAGTYLDNLFRSVYKNRVKVLTHIPLSSQQKRINKAFVIGNIRHPYDVYVSLWAFGCKKRGSLYNTFKNRLPPQYLSLYSDPNSSQNFRTWLKILLGNNTLTKLLPKPKLGFHNSQLMQKFNIGLLTYRFFALYNESNFNLLRPQYIPHNPVVDLFIRSEHMQEDLAKLKITLPQQSTKTNSSNHKPYDFYLDEETKDLIYEKDKYIFTKFGYEK